MELTKLEFAVDTTQLKEAVTLLGVVRDKTTELGKAQDNQEKAAKKSAKAAKDTSQGLKDTGDAASETEGKMSRLEKMLVKITDTTSFLRNDVIETSTGFTSMQAGVMATAKALGAGEDMLRQFADAFNNLNKVTGKNPFDQSVNGLKSLQNQLRGLDDVNKLAAQGFNLTKTQVKELSRDIEALTQRGAALGKSEEALRLEIEQHRKLYIETAQALNIKTAAAIEAEKKSKALAKAEQDAQMANATMMNDAVKLYQDNEVEKAKALANRMKLEATAGNDMVQLYYKNEEEKAKAFQARMKKEATMMDSAVAMYYKQQGKSTGSGLNSDELKATKEMGKAKEWLRVQDERLRSVVDQLTSSQSHGETVTIRSAQAIALYERKLKMAGVTGEEYNTRLKENIRLEKIKQDVEQKNQAKFLTRALQPQIGDVAISLAAGQNPLTVLLQQGDQIRGLIAQTGVSGVALQKVMRDAFGDTLKSIKDTAIAMSSVASGAFLTLGKNLFGFTLQAADSYKAINKAQRDLEAGLISATRAARLQDVAMGRMIQSFSAAGGVLAGGLLVALGVLGVALYKVAKQEDELSKSLTLSGASMGLNKDSAIAYAQALNASGVSTSDAIDVMTEMAKTGGFTASEIDKVATTAARMQKDVGISIEDTVKHFAKLKEKPVEAMLELAKSSGLITTASIDAVNELVKQGKQADAVALAMTISADVQVQQADRIKREYSTLGATIAWFGKTWKEVWDGIKGTQYKTTVKEQLTGDLEKLNQEIQDTEDNLGLLSKLGIKGDNSRLDALKATRKEFSMRIQQISLETKLVEDQRAANSKASDAKKAEFDLINKLSETENKLLAEKFTRQQAMDAAVIKAKKDLQATGGTLSPELEKRVRSVAGAEFDKSKSKGVASAAKKEQNELNKALEKYNDILNVNTGITSTFNDEMKQLMLGRDKGGKSQEQYNEAVNELLKTQPFYIKQEKDLADAIKDKADGQKLINSLFGKADDLGKEYYNTQDKLFELLEKGFDSDIILKAFAALEQTTPAMKAYNAVVADYGKTISDLTSQRVAVADQYSMDFKTDEQKAALASLSKFTRATSEADAQYEKDKKEAEGKMTGDQLASALQMYENQADTKKRLAQDVFEREKYLQSETYLLYSAGFDALKGLATEFGQTVTDEFMNFATTGKSSFEALTSSFGNMVQKMIYDLIRLRIQKQVTGLFDQLITMGVNAMIGGATGGYSGTGTNPMSLTGSDITAAFTKTQANGGAWMNGVQMYAKGGVFNGPTMFQHSGGLGVLGEAGAEAVMPLKRDSSGALGVVAQGASGGSNVEIIINNNTSEKATATESVDSRGNRKINITIGDVIASELSRSGSSTQKSMQSTFGQKPQLIRR